VRARPLYPQERGLVILVGAALLGVGLFLLAQDRRPRPALLGEPIALAEVKVVVPTFADRPTKPSLNQASAADLEALPGIGPVLAARIVAWREEHGPFRSISELDQVPGIGAALVERVRDLLTLDPAPSAGSAEGR
jgi:competence ComEA-like helix-hairpin-helix protein